MWMILGSVFLLVAAGFGLVLLINAFKESAVQGLLSIFVPFYLLYFAFARYKSPKKGLVVGGWLGASALGVILSIVGAVSAASTAVAELDQALQQPLPSLGAPPAGGEAAEAGPTYRCDLSAQPGRICNEYALGSFYTLENAREHCDMVQIGVDQKVELSEGTCPTESAIGRCQPQFGSVANVYYDDPDPSIDDAAAMSAMETLCTGTFTRMGT